MLSQLEHSKPENGFIDYYIYNGYLTDEEVSEIANTRNQAYNRIAELLSVHERPRVNLLLYPNSTIKQRETGHQGIGWAVGNNIVEIYNDSTRFDPVHELVHIIAKPLGNPPAIFNEGLAIYVSERFDSDALEYFGNPGLTIDRATQQYADSGRLVPLDSLFIYPEIGGPDYDVTYAEAGSFVKYVIENYGLELFKKVYGELKNGSDPETIAGNTAIFERVYQKSVAAMERDWLQAIAGTQ